MTQIGDSLAAVSLVFTVVTFFVSLRVAAFRKEDVESIGLWSGIQVFVDLLLASVSGLVLFIIWPLVHGSTAFSEFTKADDVLPNLLGIIAIGFGLLALTEATIGVVRLIGGIANAKRSTPGAH